jgi:hypothetical protein
MHTPDYAKHTSQELVSFSRVMTVFFTVLAVISAYVQDWQLSTLGITLLSIAGGWLIMGLAAPSILKPLFHGWMWFAYCLNFVMTRVILGVLFYVVMLPIALLMRLVGKDPLTLRTKSDSYWKVRATSTPIDHFEKLYSVQSGKMGAESDILALAQTQKPAPQSSRATTP